MPEGDNILRVATILARELTNKTIDRITLHDRGEVEALANRHVEKVEAIGKHMLVHFDNGWVLRVHLGMKGSWRRVHVREKQTRLPTVRIESGDVAYVCLNSYKAELLKQSTLRSHPRLARLGPDLLADPPDIEEAVRRATQPGNAGREVGDLIMDQRIAAGVGNIYKSETLFECRINPRARMHQLSEEEMRSIYTKAAQLMRLNLLTRGRATVPVRRRESATSRRYWVYMRNGKPCLDCGTAIQRFLQGDMGRSTYFCPQCQPARGEQKS